jgi:hypothetical protein
MSSNKSLIVESIPHPRASILGATVLPIFTGSEPENQLCGRCAVILAKGVSLNTLRFTFSAPVQFLIQCPQCRAYNTLSVKGGH